MKMLLRLMKVSLNSIVRGSQGLALFMVLYTMTAFLLLVTGGLIFSQLELKKTANFKMGTQAIAAADAGVHHALALLPWVWNFNGQLNCVTPPCTVVSNASFGTGFSYTVTAQNDLADINNGGSPTNDTNNVIVLTSEATGSNGGRTVVEAYVQRSSAAFSPPAALYIDASSATPANPASSPVSYFFDNGDSVHIIGTDTDANNLSNQSDDAPGPQPTLSGIATTSTTVTSALVNEYLNTYNGPLLHEILGVGSEPSIATVGDVLDVDKIADKFFDQPGAVKFLTGLSTNPTSCPNPLPNPRPNPDPCVLGTSATPQVTYIRDDSISNTSLRGNVTGYGVLVLEGRTTLGTDFKFYGLVVHKRSAASHYVMFQQNAWVYGGVLLGSYDENDGNGRKVRFRVRDFSRLFYSSQALSMVDSNWGSLLPKPARIFAWVEK